jgi:hypothetical protein
VPQRVLAAQQVVPHEQAGLADDEQRRRSGTGRASASTTPSVEFSTGTTPKSAAPAAVVRKTSSMLAQGT